MINPFIGDQWSGRGGGQVVRVLAFYTYDLSSNPAKVGLFHVPL